MPSRTSKTKTVLSVDRAKRERTLGGKVLVGELRSTVADDDIAIGERVGIRIGHRGGAGRCLLSG